MPSTHVDIPGFYYGEYHRYHDRVYCRYYHHHQEEANSQIDVENNKYFTIRGNHEAPRDAPYTRENIQKQERENKVSSSLVTTH